MLDINYDYRLIPITEQKYYTTELCINTPQEISSKALSEHLLKGNYSLGVVRGSYQLLCVAKA